MGDVPGLHPRTKLKWTGPPEVRAKIESAIGSVFLFVPFVSFVSRPAARVSTAETCN